MITAEAGTWDLRRAIVTGQTDRLQRYFDRLFEESSVLLRKMDENATQFITIMDMSDFNLITQGCPRCNFEFTISNRNNNMPMYLSQIYLLQVYLC